MKLLREFLCSYLQVILAVIVLLMVIQFCQCDDWQDSYIEAYKQSEGAVYEGPYPHYPTRMPMQMTMRPNMTTPAAMMPLLLQIIMIVARIMLKMTIFKIIVKFIAVVCLFLFIPTLRLPRSIRRSGKCKFIQIVECLNCGRARNSLTLNQFYFLNSVHAEAA